MLYRSNIGVGEERMWYSSNIWGGVGVVSCTQVISWGGDVGSKEYLIIAQLEFTEQTLTLFDDKTRPRFPILCQQFTRVQY